MAIQDAGRQSLTRTFDTAQGVMTYAQLADAIAPHLLALLEDIADGKYSRHQYDEDLIKQFHRRIIGEVLPDIAGKWRTKLVQVGNHIPPEVPEIPVRMHEYVENMQARLSHANTLDLQIELLAYAEGEFLHIHPFTDFNGRTVRALLAELLVRLDLPAAETTVERDTPRFKDYQNALAEYDNGQIQPLVDFWVGRFES
jgi:Fic family protein